MWSKSQTEETVLTQVPLTPSFYYVNDLTPSRPLIAATPYSYIASAFMKWRGSMVVSFSAVKTQFHSGRLELIWVPNEHIVGPLTGDFTKAVRVIWDLSELNSISVVCPYVAQNPYKSTMSMIDYVANKPYTKDNLSGYLIVRVFNRLQVASSSVSDTIEINISMAMGPDADFALPRNITLIPGGVTPELFSEKGNEPEIGLPGVSLGAAKYHQLYSSKVRDILDNSVGYNIQAPSMCFGEAILSLRAMSRRTMPIYEFNLGSIDGVTVTYENLHMGICPNPTNFDSDATGADFSPDWISFATTLFAFRKGGINLFIQPEMKAVAPSNAFTTAFATTLNYLNAKFVVDLTTDLSSGGIGPHPHPVQPLTTYNEFIQSLDVPMHITTQGYVRLDVPYYSKFPCLFNEISQVTGNPYFNPINVERAEQPHGWVVVGSDNLSMFGSFKLYRAARDDFDCGFFLGVPMCTIPKYQGTPEFVTKSIPEFKLGIPPSPRPFPDRVTKVKREESVDPPKTRKFLVRPQDLGERSAHPMLVVRNMLKIGHDTVDDPQASPITEETPCNHPECEVIDPHSHKI
jgi:hypothetical protein